MLRFHCAEQLHHAVDEGFAADEPGFRSLPGAMREMLAAAEADLQHQFVR